jgi:hypothetical protein
LTLLFSAGAVIVAVGGGGSGSVGQTLPSVSPACHVGVVGVVERGEGWFVGRESSGACRVSGDYAVTSLREISGMKRLVSLRHGSREASGASIESMGRKQRTRQSQRESEGDKLWLWACTVQLG